MPISSGTRIGNYEVVQGALEAIQSDASALACLATRRLGARAWRSVEL